MNCDALAPWYSTLEYLSFGSALLACRFRQLPHCRAAKSALMLGDGDGRFLKRFLREADQAEVDYVDCSGQMLALARSRLTSEMRERVRFHNLTAHEFQPYKQYDLVVTHFFLDCLSDSESLVLAQSIAMATTFGAIWIISEFRVPDHGWRQWRARFWISGLYRAFRWMTDLRSSQIPNYPDALQRAGFCLVNEHNTNAGLLASQLWKKNS